MQPQEFASPPPDPPARQSDKWLSKKNVVLFVVVVLVVLLPVLYVSGLLNRGYESKHLSFAGISSSDSGMSLGLKTMHLSAGEELVVDYDLEVHRGGLMIWLKESYAGIGADPVAMHRLTTSGKGQLVFPIEESGFYTLRISGSPGGDGYDVSYEASWGVR